MTTIIRPRKKTCPRCNVPKLLTAEFWHRNRNSKDGWQWTCKTCVRAGVKATQTVSRKNQMAWAREYKEGNPCTDCGEFHPYYVMQFDHLPEFEKLGEISRIIGYWSWDRLYAEIDKCELVCANCHAKRTFARNFNK